MKNKNNRLEAIRQVISEQDIKNQDQLLQVLTSMGYNVTQATLSRDLKKMKISKVANTYGDYLYVLPNRALVQKKAAAESVPVVNQPRYGFVSLNFSGNMAVIKTRPGYASSLAYDIDNHNLPNVLGTIAGDDTLLMVLSEDANRTEIKHLLEPIIISI
ncbi:MAG: arginine repressor [Bacteroidaceae bacterium]|nr:arginine repressor [Bacteroidaceae bacterium]MBO5932674.1 arginine repressor [Bacteroidaceae bacterium]MBO5952051.1 arginine repressor [Bacteroidaceae bacterium]MBQ5573616.1 arginine repressor [Bacteroidaceae bacterium]MBR4303478.1 arginine repressor [Bacteroidaceae bacterium]